MVNIVTIFLINFLILVFHTSQVINKIIELQIFQSVGHDSQL